MSYGKSRVVDAAFATAVDAVREALAEQGFGVLTEIDVQATMRAKLGEEVGPYLILGACNPPLALRGIEAEPSLGLLLPCNVTVRQPVGTGSPIVEVLDPRVMVEATGNAELTDVATEAGGRLDAALADLERRIAQAAGAAS